MSRSLVSIIAVVAALAAAVVVLIGSGSGDDPTAVAATTTLSPPITTESPSSLTDSGEVTVGPVTLPEQLLVSVGDWETDWTRRTIDLDELLLGIPALDPRDVIAPLDFPPYESVEEASEWLVDSEIGVLFEIEGVARFYPLRILTTHEIVNDEVGGVPFAVTYCPLCNTAVAFDRRVDGEVLRFGVSGLLRKSDLVMWDDVTQSLWQQITGEGIVGAHAGSQLVVLPTATVTWGDFAATHPDGEALSQNTGSSFSYGTNGYAGYSGRGGPFSQLSRDEFDDRFPALARVVGVRIDDNSKAYPFSILSELGVANDELAGIPITVWWADTGAVDNFDSARPGEGQVIGTGIAFLATVGGQVLTFAPAGPDTFVDAETGTIWTLFGEGIDGPLAGTQLETALHQNEFWFAWSAFNEGSPVLGD
jgi:hypothetical protein